MIEIYFLVNIIVGAILVTDGFLLRKVNGKCGSHPLLNITTTIEFLWAIVSIVALLKLDFSGWLIFIPALYVTHNIFGWLYGFLLMSKKKNISPNESIYIPMWYVNFGLVIGLVFCLTSFLAIGS